MNEQKNTKMSWWKRNKNKVFIIGGVVVAVGIGIVVFKNKDALIELVKKGKTIANNASKIDEPKVIENIPDIITIVNAEVVTTPINNGLPFRVNGFVRNLPNGWHPSAEKVAQAAELGIELGEHQTLVDAYMKNVA